MGLGAHFAGFFLCCRLPLLPLLQWILEALQELGCNLRLEMADDGSGIGAALIALVAESGGAIRKVKK